MTDNAEPVIELAGVGKMYKVYASKGDAFLDALGASRLRFWRSPRPREFWALRDVDLVVRPAQRIGVIGRNGAGKTTLLRLVIGALAPTEGTLRVRGQIHALLDTGGGFTREVSGRENVRAALTLLGMPPGSMSEAEADIEEFTELGSFFEQPIKTYSSGMLARLAFATATAVRPSILVIDEILGAGDAYFINKSTERMQRLVGGGTSVVLVSHALDHVNRFCEEAIWLERGRVVRRGPSMEVVKEYQQYIRRLEDRRLQAKNRKVRAPEYGEVSYEVYSDTLLLRLDATGADGRCEVTEATLMRGSEPEELLRIGDAQDAATSHGSFVVLQEGNWSAPESHGNERFRALAPIHGAPASGMLAFNLYLLRPEEDYVLRVRYRCRDLDRLDAEIVLNGRSLDRRQLQVSDDGAWRTAEFAITRPSVAPTPERPAERAAALRRWPGTGGLRIERVLLMDGGGKESAVFPTGSRLRLLMTVEAERSDRFPVIPVAVLYRRDGVLVARSVGPRQEVGLAAGGRIECTLDWGPVQLGNGYYVFTVAVYSSLDVTGLEPAVFYDMLDRSYEFQVVGTPPLLDGVVRHTAEWSVVSPRETSNLLG
jgi:lipopolysaccharide transport system ATP-binding protein